MAPAVGPAQGLGEVTTHPRTTRAQDTSTTSILNLRRLSFAVLPGCWQRAVYRAHLPDDSWARKLTEPFVPEVSCCKGHGRPREHLLTRGGAALGKSWTQGAVAEEEELACLPPHLPPDPSDTTKERHTRSCCFSGPPAMPQALHEP